MLSSFSGRDDGDKDSKVSEEAGMTEDEEEEKKNYMEIKENEHKMMKEEEARREDEEFPMLKATHRDTSGEKPDEILKGVSVNTKDS